MIRIRRLEEKSVELYSKQKIRGFLHLYIGEEAAGVGAMRALREDDNIVATYREHGQALVRGIPAGEIMAEMYGKANGCSGGRGGSMHLFSAKRRFYGGHAIVGGGLPIAVGLALADKMKGEARVTACFFGDGATDEGEFHESLNLAALWKLPVLFLCENNQYAMGTALDRHVSDSDIVNNPPAYGIPSESVNGMDVVAVERAVHNAVESVRETSEPRFLELRTYRFRAHSMYDAELYRSKEEVEEHKKHDPIANFQERAMSDELITQSDIDTIARGMGTCGGHHPSYLCEGSVVTTYRDAVRTALQTLLREDPRVFLMGEDVGRYGGPYAVSKGLLKEFGEERVRDTPLCESTFVGAGIGAALGGMRPIVEVMTVNFSLLALDQVVNNAAVMRHMSGGQFEVPIAVRMATGGGKQLAAQHSHSLENWYAHIPGIKVLAPATVQDAHDMLLAAVEDPDPVFIFEHQMLYGMEGPLDTEATPPSPWKAAIRRSGSDVSLIAYGGSVHKALTAAEKLEKERVSAEVVDLRSLRPLDRETIVASVSRTHRAVVIDEAWKTGSLASEISAILAEDAFYELDAPVVRVCTLEVPIPYAKHLEEAALPQVDRIVEAAKRSVGGG
ncbi:MAG: pyruvate dehydrogenase (acetyl-transferring) E1 component subunit alpha [Deltaproteobacteria bacterium]|nr:pyruvate dehydrogenase (acetyl-transferring) E1 component subunit alpha [Deltaproteobacteria bacterium]